MFQNKAKSEELLVPAGGSTTIIAAGTVMNGDIDCKGDIRIDGTLKGNITALAKVVIGAQGTVDGDLRGQQADIMGKVKGNIYVKDLLQLKGNGVVNGNLYASKLQIESTAFFNGQCHMHAQGSEATLQTSGANQERFVIA